MTQGTLAAPPRRPAPAGRPVLIGVIVLVVACTVMGGLALLAGQVVVAVLVWVAAAALGLLRLLIEQARAANARLDEMTRELRLLRQTLTAQTLATQGLTAQPSAAPAQADPIAPLPATWTSTPAEPSAELRG